MSKFTKRGVSLPSLKEPAASRPVMNIREPEQVFVPLLTESGQPCRPAIGTYETILRGDVLALPEGEGSVNVYAPVTGVLSDLREMTHPLLGDITCAVLDCMAWKSEEKKSKKDLLSVTPEQILDAVQNAGIIDELDGSSLYEKLEAWKDGAAGLLIADATEQEPYSSSAWAVLNESAEEVQEGLKLIADCVAAEEYRVSVRLSGKRKRDLLKRLEPNRLYSVWGRYPADPYPPMTNARVHCVGVQACLAVYHAVAFGEPQSDCVLTVAGDAVSNPQNIRVPIGTMVEDVLHCCGLSADPAYVLLGDAMTGLTIAQTDICVVPGITCLLAVTSRPQPKTRVCIGCGRCVRACHADLLPYEIMRRLDNMQYERLTMLLPTECDGCGACSHVCPAGLDVTAKVLEAREAHGTIFLKWGDGDDL